MKTPEDPAAGRPPTLVGEAAELADQDAALKAALPRLRLPPKRRCRLSSGCKPRLSTRLK